MQPMPPSGMGTRPIVPGAPATCAVGLYARGAEHLLHYSRVVVHEGTGAEDENAAIRRRCRRHVDDAMYAAAIYLPCSCASGCSAGEEPLGIPRAEHQGAIAGERELLLHGA